MNPYDTVEEFLGEYCEQDAQAEWEVFVAMINDQNDPTDGWEGDPTEGWEPRKRSTTVTELIHQQEAEPERDNSLWDHLLEDDTINQDNSEP